MCFLPREEWQWKFSLSLLTPGGSLRKLVGRLSSSPKLTAGFPAPRLLSLLGALLITEESGWHVPGSGITRAAGSQRRC